MERIIFLEFDSWLMRMTQMCYLKIEREKDQENVNVSKILDIKNVYKWGEFEVQFKSKIFTKRLFSFGSEWMSRSSQIFCLLSNQIN